MKSSWLNLQLVGIVAHSDMKVVLALSSSLQRRSWCTELTRIEKDLLIKGQIMAHTYTTARGVVAAQSIAILLKLASVNTRHTFTMA